MKLEPLRKSHVRMIAVSEETSDRIAGYALGVVIAIVGWIVLVLFLAAAS